MSWSSLLGDQHAKSPNDPREFEGRSPLAQVLMASTYPLEIVQTRTLIIRGNGKRPVVGILTKHRQRLPVATGERVAEVLQL